jgi:DDE superfamily endonuclease
MTSVLQPMDLGIIRCLKHHYRHELVLKRIDQIDNKLPKTDVNILEAINIVAYAWHNKVKPETIANCFHKAGFRVDQEPESDVDDETDVESSADLELFDNDFEKLKERLSCSGGFSEFADIDSAVQITGQLTDDDIIEICLEDEGDKENHSSECDSPEQNEVSPKKPTQDEIKKAMDVLICALEMTPNVPGQMFTNIYDVQKQLENLNL